MTESGGILTGKAARRALTLRVGHERTDKLEKQWQPGKYVRLKKIMQEEEAAREERRGRKRMEPVFIRDPRSHVEVALYDDATMTPEQFRAFQGALVEFCDPGVLPWPIKGVEMEVNNRPQSARRKRDGLDIMHEKGTISDAELVIAREYNAVFELALQARCGSVDLEGTPGGAMGHDQWLARRLDAVDKLRKFIGMAGGGRAHAALAVDRLAGALWSLRKMKEEYGRTRDYWTGAFVCGLQSISACYQPARR